MVPSLMFGQKFIGKVTPAAASSGETAFFLGDLLVAEDVGVFAAITTLSLGTIVSVEEVSKEQTAFSVAQVPQAFSFQSIVLDSDGIPVTEQAIGVKVDILEGSLTGSAVYSETHQAMTNNNGIYSINIGQGTVQEGEFASIPWSSGNKFISLSQDIDGGTNYVFAGANQLLSVPYALVAGRAEVEPQIYVRGLIGNEDNVLDNDDPQARANFRITYKWIQGTPEDIFVEYKNLPPNTHIFMYSELNNVEVEDFDNFTARDTIYDGIRIRSNRLVRK